ncbi:MAG TPA: ABC transporter ATP-binding protein [Firmicutes bacterium]|nr:ABC transporter ATP-binding protein [Bacillota bacterium]
MPDVELRGVTKMFGKDTVAVDNVNLEVEAGEFISLLGPSGCGKTTTLRMIAGFEEPTTGQIIIKGKDMTRVPPYYRNTGMVFQNYALFPHRTVAENVAFGLKMRGLNREEIKRRVDEALRMVEIPNLADRYPRQLSGGQQQRVALARAIVIQPSVLLLDEPLSALDKKLREQMRGEIKRLQNRIGITTIFVTHDQEEALTLSDRIVIMNKGKVIQVGTPTELYRKPVNTFVADFLGTSNIITGKVQELAAGFVTINTDGGFTIKVVREDNMALKTGQELTVSIRPENMSLTGQPGPGMNSQPGRVRDVFFMGATVRYNILVDNSDQVLTVDEQNVGGSRLYKPGDQVTVYWEPGDCNIIAQ